MYQRKQSKYRSRGHWQQDKASAGQRKAAPVTKQPVTPERAELHEVSAELRRYRMRSQPQPQELRDRYDELFAICAEQSVNWQSEVQP